MDDDNKPDGQIDDFTDDPVSDFYNLIGLTAHDGMAEGTMTGVPGFEDGEDAERQEKSRIRATVSDWDLHSKLLHVEGLPSARTNRAKSNRPSKVELYLAAAGKTGRHRARIGELYWYENLTAREIARREKIPLDTVNSHIFRLRAELNKLKDQSTANLEYLFAISGEGEQEHDSDSADEGSKEGL